MTARSWWLLNRADAHSMVGNPIDKLRHVLIDQRITHQPTIPFCCHHTAAAQQPKCL